MGRAVGTVDWLAVAGGFAIVAAAAIEWPARLASEVLAEVGRRWTADEDEMARQGAAQGQGRRQQRAECVDGGEGLLRDGTTMALGCINASGRVSLVADSDLRRQQRRRVFVGVALAAILEAGVL